LNPRNNWVHFLNFFILGGPAGTSGDITSKSGFLLSLDVWEAKKSFRSITLEGFG